MRVLSLQRSKFSTLLTRIKNEPSLVSSESNVLRVLQNESEIDLASYDYMMATVLKNKSTKASDLEKFLRVSISKSLTPTKEQLCILVE